MLNKRVLKVCGAIVCMASLATVVVSAEGDKKEPFGPMGEITVVDASLNPTASRYFGTWEADVETMKRLGQSEADAMSKAEEYTSIEFKDNKETGQLIVNKLKELITSGKPGLTSKDRQRAMQAIFLTGEMLVHEKNEDWGNCPFVLVNLNGTPTLFYLAEGNDLENIPVTLVRGCKDADDVLLFRDNGSGTVAFKRTTKAEPKKEGNDKK